MLKRAYALLDIKSLDDDARTFEGIASTPTTDLMDDIVEPMGAEFALPLPMLWMHDDRYPVGHITAAKPNKDGIPVKGAFVKVDEPASLKDELDRAWAMVKSKLVRGLSIGFAPIESMDIEGSWGRRYTKWRWLELSCCVIAANQDATILTVKSIDTQTRAALGLTRKGVPLLVTSPGASGTIAAANRGAVKLIPR